MLSFIVVTGYSLKYIYLRVYLLMLDGDVLHGCYLRSWCRCGCSVIICMLYMLV
jgi:hypothetical protein